MKLIRVERMALLPMASFEYCTFRCVQPVNDFKTTHFEYVCLSFPNFSTRIGVTINQIEIKYTEEYAAPLKQDHFFE